MWEFDLYLYLYHGLCIGGSKRKWNRDYCSRQTKSPWGGLVVEGPVLEKGYESFVGLFPIPTRHGMTIGELANYFNEKFEINGDLTVIPMKTGKGQ